MLNQIAVWVMDIALILFAIFKMKRGVNQRANRLEEQLQFNSYQFSLYHSKGSMVGQLLFWLVFIAVFILINITSLNAILLLSLPLIVWHFGLTVRRFLWRFAVDGHSAFVRTGLVKRHFLLTDITEVTTTNARFFGVDSGFITHLNLYHGRSLVAKIPVQAKNYQSLLNLLVRLAINGVADLIDGFGQPVVHAATKNPVFFERLLVKYIDFNPDFAKRPEDAKFALLYLAVCLLALLLFIGPLFLDGLISRTAYTAVEVLNGTIVWLVLWTVGIFLSRTLFLEGSLFMVQVRKQKGKGIFFQMTFLLMAVLATRIGMDMLLFHMDNAHFNDIGAAVADLRAIEEDELSERILNISMDTAHERLRSLAVDAEFGVVYRLWFSSDHQLFFNFPREFRPADLRAQMLAIEVENGFRGVNRGQIRVTYTPNMHVITAVEFVEQIPLADVPEFRPTVIPEDEFFLIHLEQHAYQPLVALHEFLRTSPEMDEVKVNHFLRIFTNGVIDYIGYVAYTEARFSLIDFDDQPFYLDFVVPGEALGEYFRPVRLRVTFNFSEPIYFSVADEEANQEFVLQHLAHSQPGREFRSQAPLYVSDTSTPFAFYDVNNPESVLWLWLHVNRRGETIVWASEWNRE